MNARIILGALGALALGAAPAPAQDDFSKVEIKATKVAGNVYMLEGAGGNIGVSVGRDGILIVDDQFAPLADKIKAALKTLGEGKLKFILNTHWHGDHTGGNAVFGPEATILASSNVRKRLEAGGSIFGEKIPAAPREALPVITFDDSVSIHFNDEEVRALHLPHGHTDGDSVIFFTKSNVVHMGDLFFNGKFPFVDLDSGGDVEGYARGVATAIAQTPAGASIIPGHGALATLDDLKAFHRMLVGTIEVVRKGMGEGKSLDQLKAAGLPAEWKSFDGGFIKADAWIETIYKSLAAHKDGRM